MQGKQVTSSPDTNSPGHGPDFWRLLQAIFSRRFESKEEIKIWSVNKVHMWGGRLTLTICFLKWWWGVFEWLQTTSEQLRAELGKINPMGFFSAENDAYNVILSCHAETLITQEQALAATDFKRMDQRSVDGWLLVPARSPPRPRYRRFIIYYMWHDTFAIYSQYHHY